MNFFELEIHLFQSLLGCFATLRGETMTWYTTIVNLRCFGCRHWKLTDGPAAHLDRVMAGDTVSNAWRTGGCSLGLNKFRGCWLWFYLLKVEGFLTCLWLKSEMLCPLWDLPMHPLMLDSIFQKRIFKSAWDFLSLGQGVTNGEWSITRCSL